MITVTAKDKDESSKIRYEITRGNIGGAFAVKNETGAIYVAGQLDYENRKEVGNALNFAVQIHLRSQNKLTITSGHFCSVKPPHSFQSLQIVFFAF